jgi:ATP/maltotriose-dependent transcriptional regulator MalT
VHDQGMLILSNRIAPPRLPNALVERESLLSALDGALATPLTLVSAPAGFGKTTLLSDWASQHQATCAWLSLSEMDNSPSRFCIALIAALRRCPGLTPSFGETVLARLASPPPLSSCLSALLHELESCEAHPSPIVLMVDDYQLIEDPAIHEGIRFFLEHLPAHLHLILSSRVDPDLPLAGLRVRGQLCEIRADELRFAECEASQYLGHLLSKEEVSQLVNRTEGWIAGLQLAALTMQKRAGRAAFLQTLTCSQRYLLDYVQEEILARLPTPVRDFLLQSAILSRLDASACQAVTAAPTRAASQQMLAWLERANIFVVLLDDGRCAYRLHDLFLEARATKDALLHRRLRLLQMHLVFREAGASGDYERLNSMQQEIEGALDQDEETIWQMVPLTCSFVLHYTFRQEGAKLLPRLLTAYEQVSRKASLFASLRVRQFLVHAALEAGQLRLAYEVCQAVLDLIEQITGSALLKGYFESILVRVLYQWNRLEEARNRFYRRLLPGSISICSLMSGPGGVKDGRLLQLRLKKRHRNSSPL